MVFSSAYGGPQCAEKKGREPSEEETTRQNEEDEENEEANPTNATVVGVTTLLLDAMDHLQLVPADTAKFPLSWVQDQQKQAVIGEVPAEEEEEGGEHYNRLPDFLQRAVAEVVTLRFEQGGMNDINNNVVDDRQQADRSRSAELSVLTPSTWNELLSSSWPAFRNRHHEDDDDGGGGEDACCYARSSSHHLLNRTPMVPPWLVDSDDDNDSAAKQLAAELAPTTCPRTGRMISASNKLDIALHLLATLQLHRLGGYGPATKNADRIESSTTDDESRHRRVRRAVVSSSSSTTTTRCETAAEQESHPESRTPPTPESEESISKEAAIATSFASSKKLLSTLTTVGDLVEALSPDQRGLFDRYARVLQQDYTNRSELLRMRWELIYQGDSDNDSSINSHPAVAITDDTEEEDWMTWSLSELVQHFTAPHSCTTALGFPSGPSPSSATTHHHREPVTVQEQLLAQLGPPSSSPSVLDADSSKRLGFRGQPEATECRKVSAIWMSEDPVITAQASAAADDARTAARRMPGAVSRRPHRHTNRRRGGTVAETMMMMMMTIPSSAKSRKVTKSSNT